MLSLYLYVVTDVVRTTHLKEDAEKNQHHVGVMQSCAHDSVAIYALWALKTMLETNSCFSVAGL